MAAIPVPSSSMATSSRQPLKTDDIDDHEARVTILERKGLPEVIARLEALEAVVFP